MGYQLKRLHTGDNSFLMEKACENYQCLSCGEKPISVNFVNGILIQAFVSHKDTCTAVSGNAFQRTVDVSCDTCRWHSKEGGCQFDGESDARVAAMHLHG